MNRLYENTIFLQEDYDPPYSLEIISKKYPKLLNCPIHRWRAETGIELIHQEPDEQELDRIWDNWNQMTKDMKKISDKKSIELFGIDNRSNYYLLKSFYKLSFKSPKELLEWMNDIEYGWVSKSGKIHTDFGMKFYNEYSLQSPMEVFKSKTGICWDQVFFQKYFFDKWKINNRIFYIERKNKKGDFKMRKYDYKKAIEIIEAEKQNLVNVYLGMYEDWFYTADEVWANNKYKMNLEIEPEIGGIRCSYWATPTIKLIFANDEEKMIECYIGEQDGEKPVWLELGCLSAPCQDSLPPIEKWEKNEDK